MTPLHDLLGQSLMLSINGPDATPDVLDALAHTRACGVILFAQNIVEPAQLHRLTTTLQGHAKKHGLPPLLIAIDQEGGTVSRMPAPWITVPSQMAQAATGDGEAAAEAAAITAQQLRAWGINTDFAPVLDVNNNPDNPVIGIRSFGSDPDLVARFGVAAIKGFEDAGVIATAKHFPGHGDTTVDSHIGLPTVPHARERLDRIELAPFRAAIAAGVPAIMTAHIVFPQLDDLPATLSRRILTDLLRGELGFDGVIFTDALVMRAIADQYGLAEASILSKAAGADVLLPLGPLAEQILVADALRDAVAQGRLHEAAFRDTARRLDRLRERFALTHDVPPLAPLAPQLEAAAVRIAQQSITVVGDHSLLPLRSDARLGVIDCMLPRFSVVEEALERADLLRDLLTDAFAHTRSLVLGPAPSDRDINEAVALATECDAVLLVTRNASLIDAQVTLAQALARTDVPVIHAAVRGPYDVDVVPAAVSLATYGDPRVSLQALVDVLAGRAEAQGTLPIERLKAEG